MHLTVAETAALERLATQLESDLAPCPLGREALRTWLAEQVKVLRRCPPPDSATATCMSPQPRFKPR